MIQWCNSNSGFVMALLTSTYVLCTVVIVVVSLRSIKQAQRLHTDIYRPVINCDFFTQYTLLYFRIKNVGHKSAKNIVIRAFGYPPYGCKTWDEHPVIKHGLSFLSPQSEQVSLYALPQDCEELENKKVCFQIEYIDSSGKLFRDEQETVFRGWMKEDIGRENNAPLIKKLDGIIKAMKSQHS